MRSARLPPRGCPRARDARTSTRSRMAPPIRKNAAYVLMNGVIRRTQRHASTAPMGDTPRARRARRATGSRSALATITNGRLIAVWRGWRRVASTTSRASPAQADTRHRIAPAMYHAFVRKDAVAGQRDGGLDQRAEAVERDTEGPPPDVRRAPLAVATPQRQRKPAAMSVVPMAGSAPT